MKKKEKQKKQKKKNKKNGLFSARNGTEARARSLRSVSYTLAAVSTAAIFHRAFYFFSVFFFFFVLSMVRYERLFGVLFVSNNMTKGAKYFTLRKRGKIVVKFFSEACGTLRKTLQLFYRPKGNAFDGYQG